MKDIKFLSYASAVTDILSATPAKTGAAAAKIAYYKQQLQAQSKDTAFMYFNDDGTIAAASMQQISTEYVTPAITEIIINADIDLVNLQCILANTLSTVDLTSAKDIKFTNYLDDISSLPTVVAVVNGTAIERIAWLIDALYVESVDIWINGTAMGSTRAAA